MAGLQICVRGAEAGQDRLAENLGGDVLDRAIRDLMDEADIPVFTRRDPGDDLASCDFRVDDGLATAATVVDHHDEILHAGDLTSSRAPETTRAVFLKNGNKSSKNSEKQKFGITTARQSRTSIESVDSGKHNRDCYLSGVRP